MPLGSKAECTIHTTMADQSRFYVQVIAVEAQESPEIARIERYKAGTLGFTIHIPCAPAGQESFTCRLELDKYGMLIISAKSDREGSDEVTDE